MRTNKVKQFTFILLLFTIAVFLIAGTYARFTSTSNASVGANVAAWKVAITNNDNDLTQETKNIIFQVQDNDDVVDGKIAPGVTATADVKLDLTGTEVAVAFDMSIDPNDFTAEKLGASYDKMSLTTKVDGVTLQSGDPQIMLLPSQSGFTAANGIKNITLTLTWENDDSNNADDTTVGLAGSTLSIPVKLTAKQLLAEDAEVHVTSATAVENGTFTAEQDGTVNLVADFTGKNLKAGTVNWQVLDGSDSAVSEDDYTLGTSTTVSTTNSSRRVSNTISFSETGTYKVVCTMTAGTESQSATFSGTVTEKPKANVTYAEAREETIYGVYEEEILCYIELEGERLENATYTWTLDEEDQSVGRITGTTEEDENGDLYAVGTCWFTEPGSYSVVCSIGNTGVEPVEVCFKIYVIDPPSLQSVYFGYDAGYYDEDGDFVTDTVAGSDEVCYYAYLEFRGDFQKERSLLAIIDHFTLSGEDSERQQHRGRRS